MLIPAANERSTAADIVRNSRPAKPFALRARSDKTSPRSLADHRRLELREDSDSARPDGVEVSRAC